MTEEDRWRGGVDEKLADIKAFMQDIKPVCTVVTEHEQRIGFLERNQRTIAWCGGVLMAAVIGAYVAHVLGG